MYICKKHGELLYEWCEECKEVIPCDCEDINSTRFKDLIIDCKAGEKTVTVYINHCETCGNIFSVNF